MQPVFPIDDARWYAVYTQPRAEKKVNREFEIRGYQSYLPLQVTIRQWSDRKKKVEVPLFSSYVFVKITLHQYDTVLQVPGVVKFVKTGPEPSVIREEQIQQIKLLTASFDDIMLAGNDQKLSVNDRVEIIAGPAKGLTGKVVEQKGKGYFALEIEQLGANLLISIPLHFLKSI